MLSLSDVSKDGLFEKEDKRGVGCDLKERMGPAC